MQQVKRLINVVAGFIVLAIGIAMVVLPGPAIVVIPIGLGILATEFVWARSLLIMAKNAFSNITNKGGSIDQPK